MVDLKGFLPGKDKKDQELYWALIIEPGWVQAGIWGIEKDGVRVISSSSPTAWELEDELVQVVDTALSASIQDFPEEAKEPSKTVFGVFSSWVSKGKIKDEHLERIKQICSKLSLEPVGFVVLPEAISHLVKAEEGSLLSAVVLGISAKEIELSIFSLGNLKGTSVIARSVSMVDDVAEGLSRFAGSDSLPSRFILYNGREGELEEARQALINGNWEDFKNLKLLHSPKVEMIDSEKKINAVALAGASEIADVSKLVKSEKSEDYDEVKESIEVSKDHENVKATKGKISAEDLGFVLGKDVVDDQSMQSEVDSKVQATIDEDKDKISADQIQPKRLEEKKVTQGKSGFLREARFGNPFGEITSSLSSILSKFFGIFKKFTFGFGLGKKTLVIGAAFFVILIAGSLAFWWFYPKATVTIYLSTQRLDEKVAVTVDPDLDSSDFSNKILPGQVLTTLVSGEKTESTTGTRTVGDKAKGSVTFYRVGPGLTLPAQIILIGPNDLRFSLDETTTIASGSASSPGTTNATVTAEDIGAQYNLASGTSFSVSNYSTSDIEAKSSDSFSGGSSREISAVSEEDQEIIGENLKEELLDEARSKFKDTVSSDLYFIEESVSMVSSESDFSNKVGDEASTLKLTLSMGVNAIAVDKGALTELSKEVLKDKVPSGFVLRDDQIDVDFKFSDVNEETYDLDAAISANLLPEINPEEVADKISGKYPELAEKYLTEEIAGFSHADIILKPKLPGRLGTLPHVAKNIEVEITAER